jgi:4-nitrophenyl phosphatase
MAIAIRLVYEKRSMIAQLQPPVKALILDMDGVLWRDSHPIGDLPKIFSRLRERGIGYSFVTNNGTRTIPQIIEKLSIMGLEVEPWQVISSAQAVAHLLSLAFPAGGPVYIIGETGLQTALAEKGFTQSEDNPLAVVAGLDRQISYEKIRTATLLIRSGVPFYGSNGDRTFPAPEGLIPGAGAILASIETATDCAPIIAGKPNPALMEIAMQRLKTTPQETLVVGDRLETDILGGVNAGCKTALVLTGVATLSDLENWLPKPTLVAKDLEELVG